MRTRAWTVFASTLLVAVAAVGGPMAHADTSAKDPCCFTNPRYTGVCEVTPGADESCSSILAYLNRQNSVGKSYCGNTTIRGGWQSVSCEAEASAPSPGKCSGEEAETAAGPQSP